MDPLARLQRTLAKEMRRYEARGAESEPPGEALDGWLYYTRMEDDASETQLVCRRRIVAENEEEGHAERAQDLPRSRPAAEPGTRQSAAAATPGREEVLLDLNTIFPTARYLCLGRLAVSPDHKYLAFTLDETGEERFSCYIKHLASGRLEHRLDNANCIEWANTTKPYALYFTCVGLYFQLFMESLPAHAVAPRCRVCSLCLDDVLG